MSPRLRRCLPLMLALVILAIVLAGCSGTADGGTPTPTSTATPPAPTATSSAWHMYHGQHFAISYPPEWTRQTAPAPTGSQGMLLTLKGPGNAEVEVEEQYGFSDSQVHDYCRPNPNGTTVTLAGVPMTYAVVEGVHRTWQLLNGSHYSYWLSTTDLNQPQATQAADDAVLATFHLDDSTPGCPAGA